MKLYYAPGACSLAVHMALREVGVAFDLVKVMTGGGPGFTTEMIDLYIYRYAFGGMAGIPRMGYASAAGILFGMIVFAISLLFGWLIRITNKRSA